MCNNETLEYSCLMVNVTMKNGLDKDDDEEDVCGDADNEKGCLIMNNFDYPYLPVFCVGG